MNQELVHLPHLLSPPAPARLLPWLCADGSLTHLLEQASQSTVKIQNCQHQWGLANAEQAQQLNIQPRQRVLKRKVILSCGDEPAVYAESVLPEALVLRCPHLVSPLKPLGKFLFSRDSGQRIERQYGVCLTKSLPPSAQIYVASDTVWLRQSVFSYCHLHLIVVEYFLYGHQTWW